MVSLPVVALTDLLGKTLILSHCPAVRWRVLSYSVGVVRVVSLATKQRSTVDWPELRQHIREGFISID